MKAKRNWIVVVAGLLLAGVAVSFVLSGLDATSTPDEVLARMSPAERDFCLNTLWKILPDSTARDAAALLGPPVRDMVLKQYWQVKLDGKRDRVVVYFGTDGRAIAVVLDGGPGRFYYHRDVKDHLPPAVAGPRAAGSPVPKLAR